MARSRGFRWKSPLLFVALHFCFYSLKLSAQADAARREYRNPVLFSDYSDPDVLRAGDNYYLVSSSFHFMPGIPILQSKDLVHWKIIGHVFSHLDISPKYSMVGGTRYGQGAWAPSLRFHEGRFYVYFPTPEEGIFMSSAASPEGPWTPPVAVIAGRGYEDPCPFWDDDGAAYLIHGRVGAGPLILHRMSADGTKVLDEGKVIVDEPKLLPTLEGPKLYKRDGYYYIFAPFGGVGTGSQAVLRSRSIDGPYESRTVLEQGSTKVNGPHQGGYVETPDGRDWFFHFSQRGGYGRILYLEPMRWEQGWPIIGKPIPGKSAGQPVRTWARPNVNRIYPADAPQTSDEFNSDALGPQWEWNHNPDDSHWSLTDRTGFMRLTSGFAANLLGARNTLTQQMQHESFELKTRMELSGLQDGDRAGLAMFGVRASWIGVVQQGEKREIVFSDSKGETQVAVATATAIQFEMHVAHERVSFSYSLDGGRSFVPVGSQERFYFSWWKGARAALFNFNTRPDPSAAGWVDIDWVRCHALLPSRHVVAPARDANVNRPT